MGRLVRLSVFVGCIILGGYFFGIVGGVVGFVLGGMLAMADVTRGGNLDEHDCDPRPPAVGGAGKGPAPR